MTATETTALVETVAALGVELRRRGWLCATAESCTGGGIAQALTSVAGSSDWFDRGFVTYSNAAKVQTLAVAPATLANHGAVSEQTAAEMVAGALQQSAADVAVAVTGIAGPGGGSPEKPVGTVIFAWGGRAQAPQVESCRFAGDREKVRSASVHCAIAGLLGRVLAW